MNSTNLLRALLPWLILLIVSAALPGQDQETATSVELKTVAERSAYEETANAAQVEGFLRQLAAEVDYVELTSIGNTIEGRPLWALIVEPSPVAEAAAESKPLTVLMLGGIHAGECDGKEALLALARDLTDESAAPWRQGLRLIFVPNFNADGNERRGKLHRPGQVGPDAGMGIRENAQGLDLNRDFVKLESPEVRSLVAAINAFDVDVLIDTHTTNGSLHRYELTYDIPHNPATPASIDAYLRSQLMPSVTSRVADAGFSIFYYGNFDRGHRRWDSYGYEPRYSTEYMGLRGKIGILAESYSYADYRTRIDATYAFVKAVLQQLSEDAVALRPTLDAVATTNTVGGSVPIAGELTKTADGVLLKGYVDENGLPPAGPYAANAKETYQQKDYTVQLWNRGQATKQVELPWAYVVDDQYAWAVGRLLRHGVEIHRLISPRQAEVEAAIVQSVKSQPEFQGHRTRQITAQVELQTVELSVGSYVVRTEQPLGRLIAYLLEAEADDSLATWNFFDPAVRAGQAFPVQRLLEPLPVDELEAVTAVAPGEEISLEHLFQPGATVNYAGDSLSTANWLKGSQEYVISKQGRTYAVEAASGAMRRLDEMDAFRRKLAGLDAFSDEQAEAAARISAFSDDWAHALVTHQRDLYFYDAEQDVVRQLTHSPEQDEQLATLSPSGEHVAFVHDNNLWVVDCETTEVKQLTHDGTAQRLNGILDWVYQEELYGRGNFKAFWWSPDGRQLAFLQLDQSQVPDYQVSDSISFAQTLEDTRYPKAGQPLPQVGVWLVNVTDGDLRAVDLSEFAEDDRLVARVSWSPAGEVWLQVFNRVQNQQAVVRVDATSGKSQTLFTEVSPGWIEVRGTPEFLPSGDFLWLSDLPEGRTHLFRVSVTDGRKTQLTSGDWDVDALQSLSADSSTAFVSGNISSPIESHLLAVNLDTGLVTQITFAPGSHRTRVDKSGAYFIDNFSSIDSPPFAAVYSSDGKMLHVIDAPTSDRYQYLDIRPPTLLTIPARDGLELQAMLMLPPDVDPAVADRKLPVLFHVYGGPQAPTVRNAWQSGNYWWHQMLCQQGYAVVLCDNRAARGRGIQDTWTIRGDMGRVELQDLEDAVAWVSQQAWADPQRVGMWGWSYGGYFTSYALTHSQLFKAGIAGAPVTDWRNYDAIYTERYMDLPQSNPDGYDSSSSVTAAKNLHGRLLIIHGERDDNVHMSNSLQLAYALQKAGKQFDLMIYPKNRHGIVDAEQRYHMHRLMTDFLHEHLQGPSPRD